MSETAAGPGWTKVLIRCAPGSADEVAAFLTELTGSGAETAEEGGGVIIAGYLPRGPAEIGLRRKLADFLADERRWQGSSPRLEGEEKTAEKDWQESWKSRFEVTRLTERLTVRPSWLTCAPRPEERVIAMDPAMAFGTGLHESTRLVLRFLEELYAAGGAGPRRVLDVGTGTGILAMAAALLGAERVVAIDNDPRAVEAAEKNVAANGLTDLVAVGGQDLSAVDERFDLITANIVHDVLVSIASALGERLVRTGSIVCAGILAGEQSESLAGVFAGHGLRVVGEKRENEWAALCMKY